MKSFNLLTYSEQFMPEDPNEFFNQFEYRNKITFTPKLRSNYSLPLRYKIECDLMETFTKAEKENKNNNIDIINLKTKHNRNRKLESFHVKLNGNKKMFNSSKKNSFIINSSGSNSPKNLRSKRNILDILENCNYIEENNFQNLENKNA